MSATELTALVLGGLFVIAGVVVLAKIRFADSSWRGVSRATWAFVGFVLVLIGYHAVAYAGPSGWITFAIPIGISWIVGIGLVLGLGLSVWLDLRDRAAEMSEPGVAGARNDEGGEPTS